MPPRKSFLLRIPPELYSALEQWAADELRSVNGQIEFLLTDAVRRAGRAKRGGKVGRVHEEEPGRRARERDV